MLAELGFQIDQIRELTMALLMGALGSGTIVLIGKVAINKSIKALINLVEKQKEENKISKDTSDKIISGLKAENEVLKGLLSNANTNIETLLKQYKTTDKTVQELMSDIKIRDNKIQKLLEEELNSE